MKAVDILLATHNGELYLSEQLDSLFSQTYKNINVIISDDNSTDKTLEIIREYMQKFSNIILYKNNFGNSNENFSFLVGKSFSDYIAFCDQDDVWLPNKIEVSVSALEKNNVALVHSDCYVTDEFLNIIDTNYKIRNRKPYSGNFKHEMIFSPYFQGCTIVAKSSVAKKSLPYIKYGILHDTKLSILASKEDGVYFIAEPLLYYRQHLNSQIGTDKKYIYTKEKMKMKDFYMTDMINTIKGEDLFEKLNKGRKKKIYFSPSLLLFFKNLKISKNDKIISVLYFNFNIIYILIYKIILQKNKKRTINE